MKLKKIEIYNSNLITNYEITNDKNFIFLCSYLNSKHITSKTILKIESLYEYSYVPNKFYINSENDQVIFIDKTIIYDYIKIYNRKEKLKKLLND